MWKKTIFFTLIVMLLCSGCVKTETKSGLSPLDTFVSASISNYNEDDETVTRIKFSDYSDGNISVYYTSHNQEVLRNYSISHEDFKPILDKLIDYSDVVKRGKKTYLPNTKEYPAMLTIFQYKINTALDTFNYSGALAKPEGYDDFIDDIENDILNLITEETAAEDNFISASLYCLNDDNTITDIWFFSPKGDFVTVDCEYHNVQLFDEYNITTEDFEAVLSELKKYNDNVIIPEQSTEYPLSHEVPDTLTAIRYEIHTTANTVSYESGTKPDGYDDFIDDIIDCLTKTQK